MVRGLQTSIMLCEVADSFGHWIKCNFCVLIETFISDRHRARYQALCEAALMLEKRKQVLPDHLVVIGSMIGINCTETSLLLMKYFKLIDFWGIWFPAKKNDSWISKAKLLIPFDERRELCQAYEKTFLGSFFFFSLTAGHNTCNWNYYSTSCQGLCFIARS